MVAGMMNVGCEVKGEFVEAGGEVFYRIERVEELPVFLMSLVSAGDLWAFVGSNGGMTAGRRSAEEALFPYGTVDRVFDSAGLSGGFLAVREAGGFWVPFGRVGGKIERELWKSLRGDRVVFLERNLELGLEARVEWGTAGEFGFVRKVALRDLRGEKRKLRVLDGVRNVLPAGIGKRLQNDFSCLADAYKTGEFFEEAGLGVFSLAAGITDHAEAVEALKASVVWVDGLKGKVFLRDGRAEEILRGVELPTEKKVRGVRCGFLVEAEVELPAGGVKEWRFGMDTGVSQAGVVELRGRLEKGGIWEEVEGRMKEGREKLRKLVGSADGVERGEERMMEAHQFANVLFNVMRGGVFVNEGRVGTEDFVAFARGRNRAAGEKWAELLKGKVEVPVRELREIGRRSLDGDVERVGLEYLPLTFSRRHGDPSRPWNVFRISVEDEEGLPVLNYEGNWRDIFQNWEALGLSFPRYFEGFVAKFLNASTADGYNAYRVTREGIEWEVPEPDNPWSGLGYWGDHQAVYLLRLLEWLERFYPGVLKGYLGRKVFSFARVPYRLAGYEAMRRNPRETVSFDWTAHREMLGELSVFGSDARLVRGEGGRVHLVNLAEKLLVLLTVRLGNFIPGAGIWMNTQRPEWNDANNALVGAGVSLVTLCYLRRFLGFWRNVVLKGAGEVVEVSAALAEFVVEVDGVLRRHEEALGGDAEMDDRLRRVVVDELQTAGEKYRAACYEGRIFERAVLEVKFLKGAAGRALEAVDGTLRINKRADGLYHGYNLLEFDEGKKELRVERLSLMLEGQVAVLSSGMLSGEEALVLLRALRRSALWREDMRSYLLYPDRETKGFLERGVVPEERVKGCGVLRRMLESGDERVVARDAEGVVRFAKEMVKVEVLREVLVKMEVGEKERVEVEGIYEEVFGHRAFTGRSGAMFCYEGLGCVYWHMVAKLLLAVREHLDAARARGEKCAEGLAEVYGEVRNGLGFCKTPAEYGAFPADPYSHTPWHSGAQQPGMTGQVKEEIITRRTEWGVRVEGGRLGFGRVEGEGEFSVCGVPVARRGGGAGVRVRLADGAQRIFEDGWLDRELSGEVFGRTGRVRGIDVG